MFTPIFNLEWEELDEELRDSKIDDYIKNNIEYYASEYANYTTDRAWSDEEVLQSDEIRSLAENSIKARFPIYF